MARKPYRVEINYPKKGGPQYYLARDVKILGRKGKVRKYIGTKPPSAEELEAYRKKFASEMELKATVKKADLSSSLFSSEYLSPDQIKTLERIRFLYEAVTDLMTVDEIKNYERQFEISYIQGTTSIEGNTISLGETRKLLEYGLVPEKKNLREINEVQNFANVVRYRNAYRGKVTVDFIKTLHALIMENIDSESAGSFRRVDTFVIANSNLDLTPAIMIEDELKEAIVRYYSDLENECHPFECATTFHLEFEEIHPFPDGNGRVGREILNYMLMRARRPKYPRLLFLGKDRDCYLDGLKAGDEGDFSKMIEVFTDLIVNQRLRILEQNLRNLTTFKKKTGQLRLSDFVVT
jgi:Fic family protein